MFASAREFVHRSTRLLEQRVFEVTSLAADQQDDGGWPSSWTAPSAASELEWRGFETVSALRALRSYGRLETV